MMNALVSALVQFYNFDWISMLTGFAATSLLGSAPRTEFLIASLSLVTAAAVSVTIGSLPFLAANRIGLGLNVRGYLAWTKNAKKDAAPEAKSS